MTVDKVRSGKVAMTVTISQTASDVRLYLNNTKSPAALNSHIKPVI